MAEHSEAALKALTVPKLKELLSAAGLTTTGKKDELVARLLESAPAATSTDAAPAAAEPEAAKEDAPVPAPAAATTQAADEPEVPTGPPGEEALPGAPAPAAAKSPVKPSPSPAAPAVPQKTDEEKQAEATAEAERRRKRAERFGITAAEEEEAKAKRAEKFGTGKKDNGLLKSVSALDAPLSTSRRGGRDSGSSTPKLPPPTAIASDVAAPEKITQALSPEALERQKADEEKKRKRAERFGTAPAAGEPEGKKAKVGP